MLNTKQPWQSALANLITDPAELLQLLELDMTLLPAAKLAAQQFPLRVPRRFVDLMQKRNLQDPLLLQVLPLHAELQDHPGFVQDPLQEKNANPVPGLLHKYHGRVLITLTSACAVHCRYCFRRHFPYAENNPGTRGWEKLLDYIASDNTISEVILSGGDPLSLSDKLLQSFTTQLSIIPHVKRLRFHTRLLVMLPERVTEEFIYWLSSLRFDTAIVIHVNHPREIDSAVVKSLQSLRQANITLLNQSVLLKQVNDDAIVLAELSERLFSAGVLPYYLHLLDKVQGAAHFDVDQDKAMQIHQQLMRMLPGYLVPRLVCEEAGATSKTLL